MGQIESTVQNEAAIFSKELEEKENETTNEKDSESRSESKEMLHCVKNRIDMLIEGCLLSKEPGDIWMPDSRLKKSSSEVIIDVDDTLGSENPKDADNGADVGSDCKKTEDSANEDADVSKNSNDEAGNKGNEENENKNDCDKVDSKDENIDESNISEQKTGDKEVKKETEIRIEDSKNVKAEEATKTQNEIEKKEKLKMADIISEITRNDLSEESHKKKLTTFQTFIDKVLDNSLQHVNATMKVEKTTNILELCSKSMAPSEKNKVNESGIKRESVLKTETSSESRFSTNNNGNTSQSSKTEREKSVKSETNMISLKDHIERFLERSFQLESKTSDDDYFSKHNKNSEHNRDTRTANKGGNSENFNAQGLVNNMITQGLQINKLLSPTSNSGKETQKSPNIRSEVGESGRREFSQMPYDNRQYLQSPKYTDSERINMSRQYGVGPKYSAVPQRSPNTSNFHEIEQQRGYPIRPKVEYPDYKSRIYGGNERQELTRDEQMMSQERFSGYPTHRLQKPVPHIATTPAPEGVLHPAMIYTGQYSPRHSLLTAADSHKDHTIGLLQESLNKSHKQTVHLRDCKCTMCVPHADLRFQGREHISPEYPTKLQLSPSAFPQFSPSHSLHYLPFQRLQTPQDQPPAMMRPSHSAVPPRYQMPKLLPQHPPIASPKEYSQLQLGVPPSLHVSKNVPITHRLSSEESVSTEMYAAYRQSRLDASAAYQKRSKEHEMTHSKYTGYHPSPSPRRPSSTPREDQRKEVQDILLSPDQRVHGNDWSRRRDCPSNSSSVSGETPLDLSCKKMDTEKSRRPSFSNFHQVSPDSYLSDPHRPRTQSFIDESRRTMESPRGEQHRARAQSVATSQQQAGNVQQKESMQFNTFIKHLKSSVDKYCTSPPPGQSATSPSLPASKSASPNQLPSGPVHGYQGQTSPNNVTAVPAAGYRTLSPCTPYAGGITLGQPILGPEGRAHIDNSQSPKQLGIQTSSSSLTQSQPVGIQPQAITTGTSSGFVTLEHAKRNNVSKHEPIQNIIGNHDPNDILYLICRLCSQTYGSPYGFRKHFRNQHGFEPRAEDTIVQTISATKKNLSVPNALNGEGAEKNIENVNLEVSEARETNPRIINESPSLNKSNSSSSQDLNSLGIEEEQKEKTKSVQDDSKETKCLECPECGKTFQLNDFGSYKRHCRQHNSQVKMNGTLTCSRCHLSFADQYSLKEHFNIHAKEPQTPNKLEKPVSKSETQSTVHLCVPCDKSFDDITTYQDHVKTHHKSDGPPKLSPQISLVTENTSGSVSSKEEVTETKWPDISLSVIPSHNIVKQAAESMTASACPDSSSWSDNENENSITTPLGDKVEQSSRGNNGGYDSLDVGDDISAGDKVNENNEIKEKHEKMDYTSQKSVDSSQDTSGNEEGCDFQYVHKKFSSHRKRAVSNCSQNSESSASASKQCKLSPPVLSRSDTPVTSCAIVTNENADSTSTLDSKAEESLNDSPPVSSPSSDSKSSSVDGSLKQEARHHLPFVWDRVTRSQVGRKTK